MEIPDNWLDEICKGCDLNQDCEEEETTCNCSNLLYEIMRIYEIALEKAQ